MATEKESIPAKAKKDIASASSVAKKLMDYVVSTPEQAEAAAEDLRGVKSRYKDLEEQRKAITGPMDAAKKRVMDLFREPLEMLQGAESKIKIALLGYTQEQARKAALLQAKLDEQARKEREKLEAKAQALREAGKMEKAALAESQAEEKYAPIVTAQKAPAGFSTRKEWYAEVTDKKALMAAVISGEVSDDIIQIDMVALNRIAKALKGSMNVPGVSSKSKDVAVSR